MALLVEPALIGVDWGSSSFRAFLIGGDGTLLETRTANDGVFIGQGAFETRLRTHTANWPKLPILMCGMIGSDRGWVHAPYVNAPAGLADLAAALAPVPFDRPAHIVPGVAYQSGGTAEVMRGEETLLMGLALDSGRVCLPGTHSKWADVDHGRITSFRTYLTGELRALVLAQGSLAPTVPQIESSEGFAQGLLAARSGVTHALFQSRARRLLGTLPPDCTASFVSGVLIAAELTDQAHESVVMLVARDALAAAYMAAFDASDIAYRLIDPEPLAARGLGAIAKAARLL